MNEKRKEVYSAIVKLIPVLNAELRTRTFDNLNHFDAINISEVLNDSYIINENIRNELKKFVSSVNYLEVDLESYDHVNMVVEIVTDYTRLVRLFQSNWNLSYSTWVSSFKAHKANRDLLTSGNSQIFLDYQTLFPACSKIFKDLEVLRLHTQMVAGTLDRIFRSIRFDSKSWKYYFFGKLSLEVYEIHKAHKSVINSSIGRMENEQ